MLIALEGGDGVGKTTQLQRLIEALDAVQLPYEHLREPGGTPLGNEIRQLLLDPSREWAPGAEALLFMASRAQLVSERIVPALEQGTIVLVDRFFLSTYAYQVVGRGLDETQVRQANALAVGGLVPDLTLLLDLPRKVAQARSADRGRPDRMESAAEEFHLRVGAAFASFVDPDWQAQHPECGPVVRIDASGEETDVFARIVHALVERRPDLFTALQSLSLS